MNTNDTKLTDEQLSIAYSMFGGVRTHQVTMDLKKIIDYVYECAVENESKKKIDSKLD